MGGEGPWRSATPPPPDPEPPSYRSMVGPLGGGESRLGVSRSRRLHAVSRSRSWARDRLANSGSAARISKALCRSVRTWSAVRVKSAADDVRGLSDGRVIEQSENLVAVFAARETVGAVQEGGDLGGGMSWGGRGPGNRSGSRHMERDVPLGAGDWRPSRDWYGAYRSRCIERHVARHLVPARWCDSERSSTFLPAPPVPSRDDEVDVVAHRAAGPHPRSPTADEDGFGDSANDLPKHHSGELGLLRRVERVRH